MVIQVIGGSFWSPTRSFLGPTIAHVGSGGRYRSAVVPTTSAITCSSSVGIVSSQLKVELVEGMHANVVAAPVEGGSRRPAVSEALEDRARGAARSLHAPARPQELHAVALATEVRPGQPDDLNFD